MRSVDAQVQRGAPGVRDGTLARAYENLHEIVSRILATPPNGSPNGGSNGSVGAGGILRVVVRADGVSPLRWLRAQEAGERLYWSGRTGGAEAAAVGVADLVSGARPGAPSFPLLGSVRGDAEGARYYGGLRFDDAETGGEWEAFGAYRFVLPRFELRRETDGTATLACNLVLPRDGDIAEEVLVQLEDLSPGHPATDDALPAAVSRTDLPGEDGWRANVEEALAAFAEGRMDKVVLARRAGMRFAGDVDPVLLAERLAGVTPGCFHFLFEPEEGAAFVGASPERLYRREGREILSEAVAGTRPRGVSDADDAGLGEELMQSRKDHEEQAWVRVGIEESLGALCEGFEIEDKASEMRLSSRRHLVSRVRGTLKGGVSDGDVLSALHPTPAVGGYPRGAALKEIRRLEGFDRGWWAGPVGWVGADAAEFAVGIRSGLVRGRSLDLYSGAGIVEGSEPGAEWAEVEGKISDFLSVLGLSAFGLAGHSPAASQNGSSANGTSPNGTPNGNGRVPHRAR